MEKTRQYSALTMELRMRSSCHRSKRIFLMQTMLASLKRICGNQRISAAWSNPPLGLAFRSVTVTSRVHLGGRNHWRTRAKNTVSSDRRRQSCRTHSNPSWPLAFSPSLQLVLSRKKLSWSMSPWLWKKRQCRSSKNFRWPDATRVRPKKPLTFYEVRAC